MAAGSNRFAVAALAGIGNEFHLQARLQPLKTGFATASVQGASFFSLRCRVRRGMSSTRAASEMLPLHSFNTR